MKTKLKDMKINQMRIKLMVLALSSTLSACMTVGPDYVRPNNTLPTTFSQPNIINSADISQEQKIQSEWWLLYQDTTLNTLIADALKNNTDLKLAVVRIEEADAYAREIGASALPQVDMSFDATRTRVTETGAFPVFAANPRADYKYQFSSNFELDFWGKVKRAKEAARAQLLSTTYAKDATKLTLTNMIAHYYLTLRSVESQLAIARDSLRSRNESLALTKRRLEGGVASALDVHQAEVSSSNLAADIADYQRQRAIAEHQLATLTGQLSLKLADGNLTSLPIPPMPPSGLPSSLLENRPDVRQAEQELIAANANIGFAKAAIYPSISLTGIFGAESLELSNVLKSASRIWTGGLNVRLPIFNAGKLNARVEQASARQKQSLVQYEASLQSAFKEVNDALVNLRQYTERENALNQSVESAKKALKISENRYQSGYSTYLDVLDAQRVYNDVAINAVLSRQARLAASVDLFKAFGGGWSSSQTVSVTK